MFEERIFQKVMMTLDALKNLKGQTPVQKTYNSIPSQFQVNINKSRNHQSHHSGFGSAGSRRHGLDGCSYGQNGNMRTRLYEERDMTGLPKSPLQLTTKRPEHKTTGLVLGKQ